MLYGKGFDLPPIPAKRYFAIGEVSQLCEVKPHVLRYWEQEFPQLNPVKRRGNRRYYQFHEVKLVRTIRHLLHVEGFTINGARAQLDRNEKDEVSASAINHDSKVAEQMISWLLSELKEIRKILE